MRSAYAGRALCRGVCRLGCPRSRTLPGYDARPSSTLFPNTIATAQSAGLRSLRLEHHHLRFARGEEQALALHVPANCGTAEGRSCAASRSQRGRNAHHGGIARARAARVDSALTLGASNERACHEPGDVSLMNIRRPNDFRLRIGDGHDAISVQTESRETGCHLQEQCRTGDRRGRGSRSRRSALTACRPPILK